MTNAFRQQFQKQFILISLIFEIESTRTHKAVGSEGGATEAEVDEALERVLMTYSTNCT